MPAMTLYGDNLGLSSLQPSWWCPRFGCGEADHPRAVMGNVRCMVRSFVRFLRDRCENSSIRRAHSLVQISILFLYHHSQQQSTTLILFKLPAKHSSTPPLLSSSLTHKQPNNNRQHEAVRCPLCSCSHLRRLGHHW